MDSGGGGHGRIERIAGIGAIVLLAGALAASEIARYAAAQKSTALEARVSVAETEAEAALRAVIAPEVIADVDQSVYMVVTKQGYVGSAFVVDRERGILATAAHVAAELKPGGDQGAAVVNRHSKRRLPVAAVKIHAGYGAFRDAVEAYQPIKPDSRVLSPEHVALHDLANDAALLIVDPIDPATGENSLGPAMPIAPEADLLALAAGDPIAAAGFPFDVITMRNAELSAASRVERGTIAAMIAPIDVVEDAGDATAQNLIIHRMATAPGSSGGPVFDRHGRVIGISSHGFDSQASNGDSVAQRAEVIYDMLEPLREQEAVARVYAPLWKKRLQRWLRARDVLPYSVYAQNVKGFVKDPQTQLQNVDLTADMPFQASVRDEKFGPPVRNFVLSASDLAGAMEGGAGGRTSVAVKQAPIFEFSSQGEYAALAMNLPRDKMHAIFAFDYSVTYSTNGHCALDLFHRKLGAQAMSALRNRPAPFVVVPAEGVAETARHQVVVRRAPCEGATPEFMIGVVSWDAPAAAAAPSSVAAMLAPPGADAPAAQRFFHAAARTENFANCAFKFLNRTDRCVTTVKARAAD